MGREDDDLWRVDDAVAWTADGNDMVALNLDTSPNHPTALEGSAAYIWEELTANGPISAADLIRSAAEAYSAPPASIRADVLDLLERLREMNLATT